ncbi:MAG: sugar phosphate isomerase/epimerase family protein [Terriglobia bacterium]
MRRRDFLTGIGAGAFAAGMAARARGLWAAAPPAAEKLQRIGVSSWSLHNYFKSTRDDDFNLPGAMLELLDFPEMIADRYKIHHLEICAPHLSSTEAGYLKDLKDRLAKAHSQVVNMPIDIQEFWTKGGLSDPDSAVRQKAVTAGKKWIDIGATIGTKSVRCDPGKMNPQNLAPTIESYKALAAHGKSRGVQVIIENHGGVGSEHPEELVKLFTEVGSEYFGALPDFANFPDEPTRQRGLKLLFGHANVVCHAKGLEFDSAGKETKYDFAGSMAVSKQAGFKGIYSIEFEGPGDPYAGVQKTLDELLRYL